MKTTREKIEVMDWFDNGGEVQCIFLENRRDIWEYTANPSWDWVKFDYRIKPAEKKKVKLYKYAYRGTVFTDECKGFHKNEKDCRSWNKRISHDLIRLDYTMIEVEED